MAVSIDRIAAVVRALPVLPGYWDRQRLPTPGERLLLTYEKPAGDDLIAKTPNGLSLRLAGLGRLDRDLQPGDTLVVRVVANQPVLELEVEREAPQPPRTRTESGLDALSRQPAMRLDQAVMRQITWQAPDAAALAAMMRQAVGAQSWPGAESWLFPIPAWGPVPLLLRLAVPERESRSGARERRRRMGLQLELSSHTLGLIVLQLHEAPGGVQLLVACEERAAAPFVRDALPVIAAAAAHAGVRIVRMRVVQGSAALARIREVPAAPQPLHADPPEADLYRAAAETVLALQAALKRRGVSPASR